MPFSLRGTVSEIKQTVVPTAYAEDLHFYPTLDPSLLRQFSTLTPPLDAALLGHSAAYWQLKNEEAYKNVRLRQYQDMLRQRGVTDSGKLRLLAAQLTQENGAFTADRLGDARKGYHCSFGILQYNACAHNHMSAEKFLSLPENKQWLDYRFQLAVMADEVAVNLKKYGLVRCTIVWHNRPADATPCNQMTDTRGGYYATIEKKAYALLTLATL